VRNWVHCGHFLSFLWVICRSEILGSHGNACRDLYLLGSEAVKLNGSFRSKILPLCRRVCTEYGGRILVRSVLTLVPACQILQPWLCKYASNYKGIYLFFLLQVAFFEYIVDNVTCCRVSNRGWIFSGGREYASLFATIQRWIWDSFSFVCNGYRNVFTRE